MSLAKQLNAIVDICVIVYPIRIGLSITQVRHWQILDGMYEFSKNSSQCTYGSSIKENKLCIIGKRKMKYII